MRSSLPYQITHVSLEHPLSSLVADHGQGQYLIFWWKKVALAHLYTAPGQTFTVDEYYAAILTAISATVQRYAAQSATNSPPWESWSLSRDAARWHNWMDSLFSAWLPAVLPARVPVSVIICTRNRAAALQACLESLASMPCQPEEIIVVDNAPADASTFEVVKASARVKYCVEPRAGLSYARNTGVTTAGCDIIAFTDDDVLVHPDWVYRVWETFLDQQVVAMTGLVIVSELQTEAQQIFERHWSFNRGYDDSYYGPDYIAHSLAVGPPVWQIGAGANCAFRRQVFHAVGLFDERLGAGASGCSEDSEMWFRILLHGHTIHYNPRAVVYHAHRKQLTELKRQLFSYMRGFAAAALIQQEQEPQARYTRRLYRLMPVHYARRIKGAFPFFRFRNRTLWVEIRGLISGVAFYYRNRDRVS